MSTLGLRRRNGCIRAMMRLSDFSDLSSKLGVELRLRFPKGASCGVFVARGRLAGV